MKSFPEIIQTLIDINDKLVAGKIDIATAKQVANNVQVIINASRLQFDVMKYQEKKELPYFETNNKLITNGNIKSCNRCIFVSSCHLVKKCKTPNLEYFDADKG